MMLNKKALIEYLNITLRDQELSIVDDLLLDTSINTTEFGVKIGPEGIKDSYRNWFSLFSGIDFKVIECVILSPECTLIRFEETVKHLGTFKGIKATGKKVKFVVTCVYYSNKGKISHYTVSSDITQIMSQLIDTSKECLSLYIDKPMITRDQSYYFSKTLGKLKEYDLTIRAKQLECLSLWFNGYSVKKIAKFLEKSPDTVKDHLEVVKNNLGCYKKKEVFDFIKENSLEHVMTECVHTMKA
ncbi:putative ester cyclase (plasmid) [Piscirickettsia salmonis]|uniref:Ester cyclase n=3 Tax=Piscirickettsia salmonis TaxID=1238 RepID=A0A9Q6LPU2_PISSA|nr:ester cyclase [Piscirickettsia salmonis]QGN79256.1 putative ester cyclase [Piscirickettsia salmonis]QGN82847.1 putative ester cyclase [Piscirickettsia salmonis]QGN86359.1 putative ester cyclase [Piscirickettsia salmonis]QGN89863.1 putative ester cyclase [Piscirickettsia salmonis]QGO07816.1 putative ester cyclase [Piscirickettsia salmonis]